jgi:hypothetical protein
MRGTEDRMKMRAWWKSWHHHANERENYFSQGDDANEDKIFSGRAKKYFEFHGDQVEKEK